MCNEVISNKQIADAVKLTPSRVSQFKYQQAILTENGTELLFPEPTGVRKGVAVYDKCKIVEYLLVRSALDARTTMQVKMCADHRQYLCFECNDVKPLRNGRVRKNHCKTCSCHMD